MSRPYTFTDCRAERHAACPRFYFADGVPELCACPCHAEPEARA